MSQTHTIVVRFPAGIVPRYSAATEFQGGQVVAVDFGGNRLRIAQELEEALEELIEVGEYVWDYNRPCLVIARAALAKAKEVQS